MHFLQLFSTYSTNSHHLFPKPQPWLYGGIIAIHVENKIHGYNFSFLSDLRCEGGGRTYRKSLKWWEIINYSVMAKKKSNGIGDGHPKRDQFAQFSPILYSPGEVHLDELIFSFTANLFWFVVNCIVTVILTIIDKHKVYKLVII